MPLFSIKKKVYLWDFEPTWCLKGSMYSEKIAHGTLLVQGFNALKIHGNFTIYLLSLGESSNRSVIFSFPDIFSCPCVSSMSFTHFDRNGAIICWIYEICFLRVPKLSCTLLTPDHYMTKTKSIQTFLQENSNLRSHGLTHILGKSLLMEFSI